MHLQFLLAIVLVLLSFPLDCAYCRSLATPWPVAALSVSNVKSMWVQASSLHTLVLLLPFLDSLGSAGDMLEHMQHLPLPYGLMSSTPVVKQGQLLTFILGQPALSSDCSHLGPCHQREFSNSLSGVAPLVHRSAGLSPVGTCCHCDGSVTICISPIRLATKGRKLRP